jgi:hypothetical protein
MLLVTSMKNAALSRPDTSQQPETVWLGRRVAICRTFLA